jgi:hypothetical protein
VDNTYDVGTSTAGVRELNLSDANTTAPSTEGAVRVNGGALALQHFIGGALHNNGPNLYCGPTATDHVSGSGIKAETALATSFTIPAAWWSAGKGLEIIAVMSGSVSTTYSGAVTMRVRIGGVTGALLMQVNAVYGTAGSGQFYGQGYIRAILVPRSRAASAVVTYMGEGKAIYATSSGAKNYAVDQGNLLLATPHALTLDTTAAQQIVVTYEVTAANLGWTADLDILSVRAL